MDVNVFAFGALVGPGVDYRFGFRQVLDLPFDVLFDKDGQGLFCWRGRQLKGGGEFREGG